MQQNRSKRYRAAAEQVDRNKAYNLNEAVSALKKMPPTKFDQTVTVSFRLGVDPKTGTVTDDTAKAVGEVKAGRVEFKLDKNGNVAVPVGKFSFAENQLVENGTAVIEAVVRARPATAKGRFVEGVTLSATMTPGVPVDPSPYITV